MSYQAFLKIDGLLPEQADLGFEVQSFSFGVTDGGDAQRNGSPIGRSRPVDLIIVKKTDKSSPALFLACATGKHFQKGVLSLLPAVQEGGGDFQYKVNFSTLLVDSVNVRGAENGEDRPLEEIGIDFQKVAFFPTATKSLTLLPRAGRVSAA